MFLANYHLRVCCQTGFGASDYYESFDADIIRRQIINNYEFKVLRRYHFLQPILNAKCVMNMCDLLKFVQNYPPLIIRVPIA
jgi:hypothetical protein